MRISMCNWMLFPYPRQIRKKKFSLTVTLPLVPKTSVLNLNFYLLTVDQKCVFFFFLVNHRGQLVPVYLPDSFVSFMTILTCYFTTHLWIVFCGVKVSNHLKGLIWRILGSPAWNATSIRLLQSQKSYYVMPPIREMSQAGCPALVMY